MTVIFSAALRAGGQAVGVYDTDTTLIYRKVFTNIGKAYNPSTGVFKAPVSGIYYFTFFYHAGGEEDSKLTLYKNDEAIVGAYDHDSDNDATDNGGNAAFLQLQYGDHVYVTLGAHSHVWGCDLLTTFSGSLVTEL
uniref:C1q domain-containing protein n=1 Tax=Oreochromis aureus TaxID=47969 RepID=A0AAZ1WWB0_OREAU